MLRGARLARATCAKLSNKLGMSPVTPFRFVSSRSSDDFGHEADYSFLKNSVPGGVLPFLQDAVPGGDRKPGRLTVYYDGGCPACSR